MNKKPEHLHTKSYKHTKKHLEKMKREDPERWAARRLKCVQSCRDDYNALKQSPEEYEAMLDEKRWAYIKRRVEEDGDVIGADEFRTPDGMIYYAAGCLMWMKEVARLRAKAKLEMKIYQRSYKKVWIQNPENRKRCVRNSTRSSLKRRRECLSAKLVHLLRNRIRDAIRAKGAKKLQSSMELIGCSPAELKLHLESQFAPGMTWQNFGRKKGVQCWEIDHILPCASFDLTDPEQQRKCFHFTNLQPLWATDNRSKSDKVDSPLTPAESL